jgi:hypothetical protein
MRARPATEHRNLRAQRIRALLIAVAATVIPAGCRQAPLPDADSAPARLYVQRCGQCHNAYNPHSMTAAMWETQVDLMQGKMREAGVEPLNSEERGEILDYLRRNAGRD